MKKADPTPKQPSPYSDTEGEDAMLRELIEGRVRKGLMGEDERARIHALTRKVSMTDADLMRYAPKGYHGLVEIRWIDALKDLRDRYEERGKYAPAAPQAEAVAALQAARNTLDAIEAGQEPPRPAAAPDIIHCPTCGERIARPAHGHSIHVCPGRSAAPRPDVDHSTCSNCAAHPTDPNPNGPTRCPVCGRRVLGVFYTRDR